MLTLNNAIKNAFDFNYIYLPDVVNLMYTMLADKF